MLVHEFFINLFQYLRTPNSKALHPSNMKLATEDIYLIKIYGYTVNTTVECKLNPEHYCFKLWLPIIV
jgi:hypothetical protein